MTGAWLAGQHQRLVANPCAVSWSLQMREKKKLVLGLKEDLRDMKMTSAVDVRYGRTVQHWLAVQHGFATRA